MSRTCSRSRQHAVPCLQSSVRPDGTKNILEISGKEYPFNTEIAGNGRNTVPTTSENPFHVQPITTSFVDEQISDSTNPTRSLFADNTCVNHVDDGHYDTYGSLAAPGNYSHANLWIPAPYDTHTCAPFVNSNTSPLTGSTFAAGAAYDDGFALPTALDPYSWGGTAVGQGPMDEYIGAGFHYPYPSLSSMTSFPADADTDGNAYHGLLPANSFDTAQWGAAVEPPQAPLVVENSPSAPIATAPAAPPPRPACAICTRSFGRQGDLDRHAKIHQAGSRVFACAVAGCGYSSYRKDKLNEHVQRRHLALGAAST